MFYKIVKTVSITDLNQLVQLGGQMYCAFPFGKGSLPSPWDYEASDLPLHYMEMAVYTPREQACTARTFRTLHALYNLAEG